MQWHTYLQGHCYGNHQVSAVGEGPQELHGGRLGRYDHTPQKTHPEDARCAYYIRVNCSCFNVASLVGETPGNLCELKQLLPLPESLHVPCIETLRSYPFHFTSNCASIGTLHNDSNNFCFTTCSKQLLLWAGKPCSHSLKIHVHSLLEWDIAIAVTLHPYTVWTRGSCQAVSPTVWEQG